MKRSVKLSFILCLAVIGLFVPWTTYGQELVIDVLDIGQGDSILIQTPNHHRILIDGGPDESVIDQLDQLLPFWDKQIDAVLPTHPQADHITGLIAVLQRFQVKKFLDTPATSNIHAYIALKKEVISRGIPEEYFLRGSEIKTDDNITLDSLWPPPGSNWQNVSDLNDVAQVCLLRYKGFSALFTADAGQNVEQQLNQLGDNSHVDLLKVPHHGSKTGMDPSYLAKINPLISVISVGADNNYGHPSPSALALLRRQGSYIWRTDQAGRVEVRVNGAGISVYSTKIQYNAAL